MTGQPSGWEPDFIQGAVPPPLLALALVVVYAYEDRGENRPRTGGRRMIERWLYRRRR